jgi:hypothetical protein
MVCREELLALASWILCYKVFKATCGQINVCLRFGIPKSICKMREIIYLGD